MRSRFFALCKSTDGRRCNIKIVYSEKCLLLFVYPISFAQKQRICPVKGSKFFAPLSYKKAGGGRVTVPIRTRSNAQKTHIYGVKAAYNMSYIISPLFLVSAHFYESPTLNRIIFSFFKAAERRNTGSISSFVNAEKRKKNRFKARFG